MCVTGALYSDKAVNRPKTDSAKVLSRRGRAIDHEYDGRFHFEIGTSENQSGSRFPKNIQAGILHLPYIKHVTSGQCTLK